ncbi:hypothetical protein GF322_03070 [Candidatus Dependentiae bacterium]|nr:hypothetical protein [Candidatus Dependentiae bacterium]
MLKKPYLLRLFFFILCQNFNNIFSAPFQVDVLQNNHKKIILFYDIHEQGTLENSKKLFSSLCKTIQNVNKPINFFIEGLKFQNCLKNNNAKNFYDVIEKLDNSTEALDFLSSFDWIESNKNLIPIRFKFYDVDLECREMFRYYINIKNRINCTDYFYSNYIEPTSEYNYEVENYIPEKIKNIFKNKNEANIEIENYFTQEELTKYKNFTFNNFFNLIINEQNIINDFLQKQTILTYKIFESCNFINQRIQEWYFLLTKDNFLIEVYGEKTYNKNTKQNLLKNLCNIPILQLYNTGLISLEEKNESEIIRTLDNIFELPDASLCQLVDLKTICFLISQNNNYLSVVFAGGFHANYIRNLIQNLGYELIDQISPKNTCGKIYPDFFSAYYDQENLAILGSNCFDLINKYA